MGELFEVAPVAILAAGVDDLIIEANAAAAALAGVPPAALRGTPLGDLLPDLPPGAAVSGVLHRHDGSRVAVDVRRAPASCGDVLVVTEAIDRLEADAALRARRRLIEAAAERAQLTVVLDRTGVVVDATGPRAERPGGILGLHWRHFVHPDDAEAVGELLTGLPEDGDDLRTHEFRLVEDDRTIWVEGLAYVVRGHDGAPESYAAMLRDISERRQREEQLRTSERQLDDAFSWSSAGLAIGADGALVRANWALAELLGRSPEELVGRDLLEFTHPDDRALTHAARAADVPLQYEKRYVRADGTVVWALVGEKVLRTPTGDASHFVGSIVDITSRKRAEEELARRVAQQAAIVDLGHRVLRGVTGAELYDAALEAVVAHLDVDRADVLEVMPGGGELLVRRATGWNPDPTGRRLDVDASQAGYAIRTRATVVSSDLEEETRFRASDLLREAGVRSSVSALVHAEDDAYGVLAVHSTRPQHFRPDDVTFLEGVAAVVGSAVSRMRYAEIAERAHQQDRLAVVGQMAAGLAHDFNNVLTVVKLHAELLGRQPGLSEEGRRQATTISAEVDRAIAMVWQLLDVARRSEIRLEPVDLAEFVRDLAPLAERSLPAGSAVRTAVGSEPAMVAVDTSRLNQIVLNLVANARDAMPAGGTLTLSVVAHRHQGAPGQLLEIRDSGTGMTPEVEHRAFDPFFSTKGPGRGTGLGLAQVRALVDQHGGEVMLDTGQGRGTAVQIWLPAPDPEVVAPSADGQPSTAPRSNLGATVLVVEDDPAVAAAVEAQLRDLGYSVVRAGDGREALEVLSVRDDVAIVLSDLSMPKLGGEGLARELRRDRPDLPIVLTGAQPVQDPELRDIPWLEKPYAGERLAQLIAQRLAHP